MSRFIATFCFVGLLRPAPGTWGSLAGVIAAWAITLVADALWLFPLSLALFVLGWWATADMTRGSEDHDPSEIVIDEVVGQWLALSPVFLGTSFAQARFLDLWPGIILAFVAFRAFDILKPGPVGWADRQHTALGVMLDDVIAGLLAAILVAAGALVFHGI